MTQMTFHETIGQSPHQPERLRTHTRQASALRKAAGWLIVLCCLVATPTQAQRSYGGNPLAIGVEKTTAIGAPLDIVQQLPPFNVDSLLAIDALPGNRIGGLKFAHTLFTNLSPENAGATFTVGDSIRVWKVGVRSPGAYSLNVLFSEFDLPDGASVYVYNDDRSTVLGGFTNQNKPDGGEFSVAPVEGDALTIEYHEPIDAAFRGRLRITEINHDYLGLFRVGTRFNQLDLPCLPEVSCDSTLEQQSRSTCLLIVNGNTYCTGTLLNNTAGDGKPYVLTASHCLQNNASYGSRVVAFFNYQAPRCNPKIRGAEAFSLSGSKTRALSNEVDFALLELNELPPADYRPYLSGWTTDTINTANPYINLHHPWGEPLKYSLETDTVIPTNWTGINDGIARGNHWRILRWEKGHTWYGSSGSPLFDKHLRLCGGLTGGDSGGEKGCDSIYVGDFFFRFYKAWDQFPDSSKQLKYWLAPGLTDSTNQVIAIDGMDPYQDNPARRVSNILPTDSIGILRLQAPEKGPLVGQNSLGFNQYAEHFTTTTPSMAHGIYLMAVKGTYNTDVPVTVRIHAGGDSPGILLAKAILNPSYKDYISGRFTRVSQAHFGQAENYLRFTKPISVGTDFYVSYQVYNTLETVNDTFYIYTAIRPSDAPHSAWFMGHRSWLPLKEHPNHPVSTALWIEPVLMKDTITQPVDTLDDSDTINVASPVIIYAKQEGLAHLYFPSDWTTPVLVEVYDIAGKRRQQFTAEAPVATLRLATLRQGLYLIRLSNGPRLAFLKLLIPSNP
jgi:lysyl endopeptidase